eukprot:CAMPEP_0116893004 /NCGR_PEP_ID=MMETSP0467-20121206/3092_1 /TAXON_ID=283647 /ORGANISM="Mesodinium pulex, Strain SPMC105" /LENGTH=57 /DNA_ID=CAMNT_0004562429 /DNA_START=502 /DNA_END=675 /DNA_ORIENTATION=+
MTQKSAWDCGYKVYILSRRGVGNALKNGYISFTGLHNDVTDAVKFLTERDPGTKILL